MNKQRSVTAELAAIAIVLIGVSLIVWNLDPSSSSPVVSSQNDKQSNDIAIHVKKKDDKWIKGKELFKSNCASCHHPLISQTGPALQGVTKRWEKGGDYKGKTSKEWLHIWVKNWEDAVKAGYPYALNEQNYSPSQMTRFVAIKDQDIDAILEYVESYKPISEVRQ